MIDPERCIYLRKGKCGACLEVCPSGAIDFKDKEKTLSVRVGSVILSSGFKAFDPSGLDTYQYSELPNVVTGMEFERLLSAQGPQHGKLVRLSDGKEPRKIAWLQCVGSRDTNRCGNGYCSSVCCMYAVKEAMIAKEHAHGELDCAIFNMDLRLPSSGRPHLCCGECIQRASRALVAQGIEYRPAEPAIRVRIPASAPEKSLSFPWKMRTGKSALLCPRAAGEWGLGRGGPSGPHSSTDRASVS